MWGVITPWDRILTWAKRSTSIHFSLLPNRGCDMNSHLMLLSLWLPHSEGCTSNCSQRNSFLPPQGTVVQGFVTRTRQIAKCKGISSDGEVISYFQVRRHFAGVTGICLQFQRPGIRTQSDRAKPSEPCLKSQLGTSSQKPQKQNKYFMLNPLSDGVIEPEGIVQLQFFCVLGLGAFFHG